MVFKKLYPYRFEIFFLSEFFLLFGSVFMSDSLYQSAVLPLMFILNIVASLVMMSKGKFKFYVFVFLVFISLLTVIYKFFYSADSDKMTFFRMALNFLFYVFVTYEIIIQVWSSKRISAGVIFGLISGYVSLGLIGYLLCISVELAIPGSFQSSHFEILPKENLNNNMMYYSYITLLTIGYGDITPVTSFAQKVSILIGLFGQLYIVIITSIVVGKYINQIHKEDILK